MSLEEWVALSETGGLANHPAAIQGKKDVIHDENYLTL